MPKKIEESSPACGTLTNRESAIFFVGNLTAAGNIGKALTAETLRGWIQFQEKEVYQYLGFKTFNQFLKESPYSPMSRTRFYEKKSLLDSEGDQLFDIFNIAGISERKRKLLGAGNLKIEQDKLIVKDQEQEVEIDLTDNAQLVQTLTAVVDRSTAQAKKLEQKQQSVERAEEKIEKLNTELEDLKISKTSELDSASSALIQFTASAKFLIEQIEALPAEQASETAVRALTDLSIVKNQLLKFYDENPDLSDREQQEIIEFLEKEDKKNEIIH